MATAAKVRAFLNAERMLVVGASTNRDKFGNKVLRALLAHAGPERVTPINPKAPEIEGVACAKSVTAFVQDNAQIKPENIAVSLVTPPAISKTVLEELAALGVSKVWMQPGAHPDDVDAICRRLKLTALSRGPCVLIETNFEH